MAQKSGSNKLVIIGVVILAAAGGFFLFKSKKVGGPEGSVSSAKDIYDKNCAMCHRGDGGGSAGPNLTDDFWVYGKTWKDVENFTAEGNEQGGMPAYKNILTPDEITMVTDYVRSLQGTNPPDAKAPQGFGYKMPQQ